MDEKKSQLFPLFEKIYSRNIFLSKKITFCGKRGEYYSNPSITRDSFNSEAKLCRFECSLKSVTIINKKLIALRFPRICLLYAPKNLKRFRKTIISFSFPLHATLSPS